MSGKTWTTIAEGDFWINSGNRLVSRIDFTGTGDGPVRITWADTAAGPQIMVVEMIGKAEGEK